MTLTYHKKLKKLIIIVKELIRYCENQCNAYNKVYKIYLNNQILLKMTRVMFLTLKQEKLQRI